MNFYIHLPRGRRHNDDADRPFLLYLKQDMRIRSWKESLCSEWRWQPKDATDQPTEVDTLGENDPLRSDGEDDPGADG